MGFIDPSPFKNKFTILFGMIMAQIEWKVKGRDYVNASLKRPCLAISVAIVGTQSIINESDVLLFLF